ncbi:hypothetical protein BC628DRAFT_1416760 [Trametes gibbosa]|nr:hypothetical protein BC628DRAFT_1416760 [Trametes gibbosa]
MISVFNTVIEMCSGGHHVEGLREVKADLEKELKTEEEKTNPDALSKNLTTKAYQTQVEREKRIATLKERIGTTGYWLVKLYRHEGFTQAMGLHVSKNEDKPNQHQDVMERLLDWIAKVVVRMSELKDPPRIGSEEWMTDVLAQLWGKEHRKNYGCEFKVLNSPYMFTFCREVSQFVYLRDGDKVKPTQLFSLSDAKGMGGGHMWMLAIQLSDWLWHAEHLEEDAVPVVFKVFPWDRFPYLTGLFIADLHRSIGELADMFQFVNVFLSPNCPKVVSLATTLASSTTPLASSVSKYTSWEFPHIIFFMMTKLCNIQGHLSHVKFNTHKKGSPQLLHSKVDVSH